MANKNNINIDSVFTDIANSIRAKKGTTNPIQPINMAEEIDDIVTGITPSGKIEITNTEEIDVSEYASAQIVDSNLVAENIKEGVSILGKVGTFKGGTVETEERTVTPTKSEQIVTPTAGKYLSKVTVNTIPSSYIIPSGNKEITENGTNIDVRNYETVDVNIHTGITPSGTLDITENGTHDVTEYANVNVNVVSESTLKKLLDTTKSANNLFSSYQGTSVDGLIQYSDTENVTSMNNMFSDCSKLQTIPQLNTSKVTTGMYSMFYGCQNLKTIPQLDTSNVTNMSHMFYNCYNLKSIPQLDTSNVTNMGYMFLNCPNLQTIPQLNTSKVTTMDSMFSDCRRLQSIDLTHMNITSTLRSSNMCNNCHLLTKLIIRNMDTIPALNSNAFSNCYHFTGEKDLTYNPQSLKDGRIYVPDNMVASLKSATNWSKYASIIVGLSELYTWVTTSKSFNASMNVGFNVNGQTYFGTTEKYSIDLGPNAKNISISSNTNTAFVTSLADYSYNSTTGILTINKLYNQYPISSATITVKYDTRKHL